MKRADIIILIAILMVGCVTTEKPVVTSPIPMEDYDEQPFILYQAYDERWGDDPFINPVFVTKAEAGEYAKRNNMSEFEGGHSYIVREVNYRYEVRQVNDAGNDLLFTCRTHNEAYEYVVEYSSSHSDLVIYDLKTGRSFAETP